VEQIGPLLATVTAVTPLALGLVALAGLLVGIAPSSLPLLSVAAGLAASRAESGAPRLGGLWLASGFALGIATVDAVIGALLGVAGFAVLRVLASFLALAYGILGATLAVAGLALLRIVRIAVPVLAANPGSARTFVGSYVLGLPFGLSTCPACTPLILPVALAAATTGDPALGATLMLTFGLARGVPIVLIGATAGQLVGLRDTRAYVRAAERIGGVLLLAAAAYFLYRALVYGGWIA